MKIYIFCPTYTLDYRIRGSGGLPLLCDFWLNVHLATDLLLKAVTVGLRGSDGSYVPATCMSQNRLSNNDQRRRRFLQQKISLYCGDMYTTFDAHPVTIYSPVRESGRWPTAYFGESHDRNYTN